MRRNKIQVSSGTYCKALAQLERRMMSQMDLTKLDSDWVEAMALGALVFFEGIMECMSSRFTVKSSSVQARKQALVPDDLLTWGYQKLVCAGVQRVDDGVPFECGHNRGDHQHRAARLQ